MALEPTNTDLEASGPQQPIADQDAAIINTAAALNPIKDADYAVGTTCLASSLVLQQAGVAVLAQANQQPQKIPSLLPRGTL